MTRAATDLGAEITIRELSEADQPAMVELIRDTIGWPPGPQLAEYLEWKHRLGPFGVSHGWVAEDAGAVVGLRMFLRWEFDGPGGERIRAVRAVDTATAHSHQGRGIFTRLTLHAVQACRDEGCHVVFNTPNAKSRPGYLKMGWRVVGRLPVSFRVLRPAAVPALARAGVAAERFSEPARVGEAVSDVLDDAEEVEEMLAGQPPASAWRTARSLAYLRWRFAGFAPLNYRAVVPAGGVRRGLAVFRIRRRGPAREAAIVEVLGPDERTRRSLLKSVSGICGADYALNISSGSTPGRGGFLPMPRQGPILTCRALRRPGPSRVGGWDLSLGDVELF